jgi:glycosyltransferase involved in cell wall biosynthesis
MKITVFTSTYNRAHMIENLYRSLQRQTFRDFEWLIVDDGSSDNTEEVIAAWQREENDFSIRYHKKANGGKHTAINRALELAAGKLFFVVDSDDYLTDDALEKLASWEETLPAGEKYCGVAGNLGTGERETPNSLFDGEYLDGTLLDRYSVVNGERAMVFYTDIHREYPYPVFAGERFMTEAVVYNRMAADGYNMRFYNDIVCVYEYQPDGLTRTGSSLFLNNPKGYGLWLREKAKFEKVSGRNRLKMYYTFTCDLSDRLSAKEIADCIGAPYVVIGCIKLGHELVQFLRKCLVK